MKKIICCSIIFVFICVSQVMASDGTVVLELAEHNGIEVPDFKPESFMPTNQDGEIVAEDDNCAIKVLSDSEVFESKAGKAFERFINEKVVDKKLNIFSAQIGRAPNSEI